MDALLVLGIALEVVCLIGGPLSVAGLIGERRWRRAERDREEADRRRAEVRPHFVIVKPLPRVEIEIVAHKAAKQLEQLGGTRP